MQFKVPQFIDVEDKLFGPFTFKEFVYLAGGAGLIYVIYKLVFIWIAIPLIIFVAALSAALTFYKINNKPFIYYLQAGITYSLKSKLYIWKQHLKKPEVAQNKEIEQKENLPKMTTSRLKDLAWSLDVLDQAHK